MKKYDTLTCGIFYCRDSAEINGCGSLQTSSWLDSEVLRNRQQKHTANRYQQGEEKDSDNENDRNNGLRMKDRNTIKEKDLDLLDRSADTQLVHCLLPNAQANASQKSKSQILLQLNFEFVMN